MNTWLARLVVLSSWPAVLRALKYILYLPPSAQAGFCMEVVLSKVIVVTDSPSTAAPGVNAIAGLPAVAVSHAPLSTGGGSATAATVPSPLQDQPSQQYPI